MPMHFLLREARGSFEITCFCDRFKVLLPATLRSSHHLPTWDEITVVQLSAGLAFSYVFAFVIFAWSSGIAALR
jgi:hypothetical protein